jgi:hypothetical protein
MMSTKGDRLQNTLAHLRGLWHAEQRCQCVNAVNEGAWSVQVLEPVLAALDWPRLPQGETGGPGAYFEWGGFNGVDVALISAGRALAFLELKDTCSNCVADLQKKLRSPAQLDAARYAVAAWFDGDAGFAIHSVRERMVGPLLARVRLFDPIPNLGMLARLAAPVLLETAPDGQTWLRRQEPDPAALHSRGEPRRAQRRFFEMLSDRLKISPPPTTREYGNSDPPTPTHAYAELPGIWPAGWGLAFRIDWRVNLLVCLFYRGSKCRVKGEDGSEQESFDGQSVDERTLAAFLDGRVLPHVERWHRDAIGR